MDTQPQHSMRTAEEVADIVIPAKEDSVDFMDSELDIFSERFNPLRALYAPEYRISKKKPKVIYPNLAAFERAYKRFGIMNLNKSNNTDLKKDTQNMDVSTTSVKPGNSKVTVRVIAQETHQRRFKFHQKPVKGSERKEKDTYIIFIFTDGLTGPMLVIKQFMKDQRRKRVMVRHEHGIREKLQVISLINSGIYGNAMWAKFISDVKINIVKINGVVNHKMTHGQNNK